MVHLPRFVQGQPIPIVDLPGIPNDVRGAWSLWRIGIQADDANHQRIMPLFQHVDGRCLVPTAKRIWDEMLSGTVQVRGCVKGDEALSTFSGIVNTAEQHGRTVYDELLQLHRDRLVQEREKGEYAFAARRRTVERIGLPAVRKHRLARLDQEEQAWREQLERKSQVSPELVPLIVVQLLNY